jgi:hypothetical protein
MFRAIALIPTIFESRYLDALIVNLRRADVSPVVVCNDPRNARQTVCGTTYDASYMLMFRPGWGIYRSWNFGLRLGSVLDRSVLILNDDLRLYSGAIERMVETLKQGEWAILGFDYRAGNVQPGPVATHGSMRVGGVGGFAFGCNPKLCTRVDRRFMWWGGDDDLFLATERAGGKVGILNGAVVEHPEPSLSARAHPELLPEGWAANDAALLREKYGSAW